MFLRRALMQAKDGRLHILNIMLKTISEPNKDLAQNAPRIVTIMVKPEKVREVIGQGERLSGGLSKKQEPRLI